MNDTLGALEATKLELYGRIIAPYEYWKRAENGDVYNKVEDWLDHMEGLWLEERYV